MPRRKLFISNQPHRGQGGIKNPFTIMMRYLARVRTFSAHNPVAANYAIDGFFITGAIGLAGTTSGIFALRLGAGDFHLTMLQFLPQVINLLILIPIGLFADSLRNKARMVSGAMISSSFLFLMVAVTTFLASGPLYFLLIFMALANASNMVYNIAWLGFFPEVVEAERRNAVLTIRSRVSIVASLLAPLISGAILASIPGEEGKILAHQIFFVLVALLLLANAFHLRKIKAIDPAPPKKLEFGEIKKAGSRLIRNKPFIFFAGVALFFHMTWHLDWTLYFIGQANYLEMNEFQLSLVPVGTTLAQFITLKFWSNRNKKHGVEKPVTFGILGLAFCPVAIFTALWLPLSIGPVIFLIMHTMALLFFATISLNLFQCLLPVLDTEYRSFSVSVYTCLTTLSNAIMPVVGVAIYRGLGGDINGLRITFVIVFCLRIAAAGLWWLRIKILEIGTNRQKK